MISKSIRSIGVELECGMSKEGIQKIVGAYGGDSHFQYGSDGSVHVTGCYDGGAEYRYWHYSLPKLMEFLKLAYKYAKLNSTCGFHIHVKFKDMDMAKIFSFKEIFNEFITKYLEFSNGMRDKSKYERRTTNTYCKGEYKLGNIKDQLRGGGNRYTAINLQSIRKHKTLEFRIFPHQSTVKEAEKTLKWLVKTLEGLLNLKEGMLMSKRLAVSECGIKDMHVIRKVLKVGEINAD